MSNEEVRGSIIKYLICYFFEKYHRYVFDNYFLSKEDKRYKKPTLKSWLVIRTYFILFELVYSDFREYLNWWHSTKKYVRYKKYEQ
jgi:hypothetical protein